MAKSLMQLNKQIANLQKQAEGLKAKEKGSVIVRIKEAIAHYGLTQNGLFGSAPAATKVVAKGVVAKTRGRRPASAKKAPLPPKFQDGSGNTWSGHGKRPNWFKDAIAAGKRPDDLLVR